MDDLKRQKIKRIDSVVCPVVEGFNQALMDAQLSKLYDRKQSLIEKLQDTSRSELNRAITEMALSDVEHSINMLLAKIDVSKKMDLNIDEAAAEKFLDDNPDLIVDTNFEYGEE